MWWVVLAIGGGMVLLPGILNPFAPFNGLTLIGIIVALIAANKLSKGEDWK